MRCRGRLRCALVAAAAAGAASLLRRGDETTVSNQSGVSDDELLSGGEWHLQYRNPLPALKGCVGLDCVQRYVKFNDHGYQWRMSFWQPLAGSAYGVGFRRYQLDLTSQTWLTEETGRGRWAHVVTITVPASRQKGQLDWAVLAIDDEPSLVEAIASVAGVIGVHVSSVPNTGIDFKSDKGRGVLHEEVEKAYSWMQFVRHPDQPEWTIELPSCKAAIRAMDAASDFMARTFPKEPPLARWVVTGASKRGIATYHVGAVDSRVKAIMPVVIALNRQVFTREGMRNMGGVNDGGVLYDREGIFTLDSEANVRLDRIVDPWYFIDKFTMPKLIMNVGQDSYFYPDCHQLYWDRMPEPKSFLMYGPSPHQSTMKVHKFLEAAGAFVTGLVRNETAPKISWDIDNRTGEISVYQVSDHVPTHVRVWHAITPTSRLKDFRRAHWKMANRDLKPFDLDSTSGGRIGKGLRWSAKPGSGGVPAPQDSWLGLYIEFEYPGVHPRLNLPWRLSTHVSVWPRRQPFPDYNAKVHNKVVK